MALGAGLAAALAPACTAKPAGFPLGWGAAFPLALGAATIVRHNGIWLQEGIQCGLQAALPGHICGHSGLCRLCRCLGLRRHGRNIR